MHFATLADWLAWQETLHPRKIDLGLARVAGVLERMGLNTSLPFTITVGGTNGKGSCVALLEAILRSAGYRVGTYTSPHLLRYNERIRIDGRPVGDGPICEAFYRIDRARGETSLSFFEFGTLAALDIFAEANLDVQLLEVGLGGRLDAVNIVDTDVALLASIAIDHRAWLGDTREAIGLEKAGIFRQGRPAVVGDPNVPASVIEYARAQGAVLSRLGHDFHYEAAIDTWSWQGSGAALADLPYPILSGEHQLLNAAAVLEVLHRAGERISISEAAIRGGLRNLVLPGRFQLIQGEIPVVLDVAHNPQAAGILSSQIRRQFPGKCIHAVFAAMRDKDIIGIICPLRELVQDWYLAPLTLRRAASPEDLREIFRGLGVESVALGFADCGDAFACARRNAQNGDLILVFGSFYLVSEYLAQSATPEVPAEWMSN